MEKLYNWHAKQQSGVIKIYGTDARGVTIVIPDVVRIECGRVGLLGRNPPRAVCKDGSRYLLV